TGPSNTQLSKQAALRRPRAVPALPSALRGDRQLRATDIDCLQHALACGCHPAAYGSSGAGGRSRTSTANAKIRSARHPTPDYVTCTVARGDRPNCDRRLIDPSHVPVVGASYRVDTTPPRATSEHQATFP